MHKSQVFTYGGYKATLCAFRGTVAEAQQSRTVHTRVSGGGTIVGNQIIGNKTSICSSTTEYVHDRFFLVDEAAQQEHSVSLTDWNFPARAGNDVAFC